MAVLLVLNLSLFKDLVLRFDVLMLLLVHISGMNLYSPVRLYFGFYKKPYKDHGYIPIFQYSKMFFCFCEEKVE